MRKIKMNSILLMLFVVLSVVGSSLAATVPGALINTSKNMSQKKLNANAWEIYCTNYGPFVNPQTGSGGFWPQGTGHGYIYGAGLWVGAKDASGKMNLACGYNPNSGQHEFGPVDLTGDYSDYLSDKTARLFLSTDPTDYNEWPVIENGKKIIKSRQDSYGRYNDLNKAFTFASETPVGIEVEQFTYAWNYADNNDIIFAYFKVKNINTYTLNEVYLGPCADCDIGNESGTGNDLVNFDANRNLAMQRQKKPEPGWDKTGVVGFRYFESPINNTGDTVYVTDVAPVGQPSYSKTVLPDSALGMTAFKIFTIEIDPSTDKERFLTMQGYNYKTMKMDAYDEGGAINEGDKRFVMSSGPFKLGPDSIATTCVGIMAANDTSALKALSDIAQDIYNNKFELAAPPAAPTLTLTPGDKCITLSWDYKSETTPDAFWDKIADTSGWWNYYRGTYRDTITKTTQGGWVYYVDTLKVDSFEIKTSSSTSVKIRRGEINPAGGTDTLKARYNQKEMYTRYDFQAYAIYRSRTLAGLAEAKNREQIGTIAPDTTGIVTYNYDKVDGIKIVVNTSLGIHVTPYTNDTAKMYDTLGADRGLIYNYTDNDVVNGFGYYYGVSAIDYQNNAFFTKKCPVSLASNPTENAQYAASRTTPADLKPSNVTVTVLGGSDVRSGGSLDYLSPLLTTIPAVLDTVTYNTYRMKWQEHGKYYIPEYGGVNIPRFKAYVYQGDDGTTYSDIINMSFENQDSLALKQWSFGNTDTTRLSPNSGSSSLLMTGPQAYVFTPEVFNADSIIFWYKSDATTPARTFNVSYSYDKKNWVTVGTINNSSTTYQRFAYGSFNKLTKIYLQVKDTSAATTPGMYIDDMTVTCSGLEDSIIVRPDYGTNSYDMGYYISYDSLLSFFGSAKDQTRFGGIVFQPYLTFKPWLAQWDTVRIVGRYPADSIFAMAKGTGTPFTADACAWQWRGSDFEIRWRDTVVASRNCLTATVWDITNNVEVPLETGVTKKNMTKSSWCFNPTANTCVAYVDSGTASDYGMYIAGLTIYFNRRNGGTLKRMVWSQRPLNGEVWTITCTGARTPSNGNVAYFRSTPAKQVSALSAGLLDNIKVVPNPYLVRANWDVSKNYPNVFFTHLPAECTIRIYTIAGDLVRVLEHKSVYSENNGVEKWDLLTKYDKRPASGMYIYHIDAPGIGTKIGKFAIIK